MKKEDNFSLLKNSFKFEKNYFYSFLTEIIFWLIIAGLIMIFGLLISQRTANLLPYFNQAPEQISQMLLTQAPEQLQLLLSQIMTLALFLIFGLLFLVLAFLFLFSFKEAFIWNLVAKKELTCRRYWRWNGLNLMLFIFLLIFVIFSLLLNLGVSLLDKTISQIVLFFLILIFLFFAFIVYIEFVKRYKVFESIGNAFGLIRKSIKKLGFAYLFSLIIILILSLIVLLFNKFIPYLLMMIITLIIWFIFITWLRFYLFKILEHDY